MADNLTTDFNKLSAAEQRIITANAAGTAVAASKDAQGIITSYRAMTPEEYLASRGGLNPVTGKFGDSITPYELSNEEYLAARKAGGGQAINAATSKKNYDYLISKGYSPEDAAAASGYAPEGITPTAKTNFKGGAAADYLASQQAAYQSDLNKAKRVSAYNILQDEFNKYGLGSLVSDIKNYLIDNTFDPSEFSIQLQNTDAYKKRFAANQDRINKGLTALTPAQYINLEDQYQEIMRRYGLPASYYQKGDLGIQEGFNKLISNDVSATELEDRVMTAQNRLINTDVNTLDALRKFYPNITNGDLLAYTLDPTNAINDIKRKATAAEIGGAALGQGLIADVNTAEALAKAGINKAQALQGYSTIGEVLPRASSLADIYAAQGLGPYNQATAESEVFNTGAAADAARKRKKLSELERATFSGQAGISGNALNRDKASAYQGFVSPGAGSF